MPERDLSIWPILPFLHTALPLTNTHSSSTAVACKVLIKPASAPHLPETTNTGSSQHHLTALITTTTTTSLPLHNHHHHSNGFPNGVLQRLLSILRPPDCREWRLLLAIVPVSRPGKGGQRGTSTLATLVICLVIDLVQRRLLPRPGNQLLGLQGSLELTGRTIEPVPLLPNHKRQLLCTTDGTKAITTTQPDALVITLITSLILVPDPVGHLTTSRHPAQQLHALIRPNTGRQEAVHTVLGLHPNKSANFGVWFHDIYDERTNTHTHTHYLSSSLTFSFALVLGPRTGPGGGIHRFYGVYVAYRPPLLCLLLLYYFLCSHVWTRGVRSKVFIYIYIPLQLPGVEQGGHMRVCNSVHLQPRRWV